MTSMRFSALPLAFVLAPPALADIGSVATLTELRGHVLVSRNASLASATEATRLVPGMRVLTTANAAAVVRYDEGCRIEIGENRRIEIARGNPCEAHATLDPLRSQRGETQLDGGGDHGKK